MIMEVFDVVLKVIDRIFPKSGCIRDVEIKFYFLRSIEYFKIFLNKIHEIKYIKKYKYCKTIER